MSEIRETVSSTLNPGVLPDNQYPQSGTRTSSNTTNQLTFDEKLLCYPEGVLIYLLGFRRSNLGGIDILIRIENHSKYDYTIQCEYCAINGYAVYALMSDLVAAGDKKITDYSINADALKDIGVANLTDIFSGSVSFTLHNKSTNRYYHSDRVSFMINDSNQIELVNPSTEDSATEVLEPKSSDEVERTTTKKWYLDY